MKIHDARSHHRDQVVSCLPFLDRIHEAAHAWAAPKLGDDTAYRGGQATLDPTPQLRRKPIGMAVAPILSYLAGAARTEDKSDGGAPATRRQRKYHPLLEVDCKD